MYAGYPAIGNGAGKASATAQQVLIIVERRLRQAIFGRPGVAIIADAVISADIARAAVELSGKVREEGFGRRADFVGCGIGSGVLVRFGVIGAGGAIQIHNPLRVKIVHRLTRDGLICGEEMIEGAIFSHDYDYVFNRRYGITVTGLSGVCDRSEEVQNQRGTCENRA